MSRKKVVLNYMYSSFYQLFLIIVPLITAPYLARTLLPTAVGINSYVSSIVQIFSLLGLIGLNNYSIREIAYVREDKNKLRKTFSELFFLRFLCLIITVIVYLIYAYFSEYRLYFIVQLVAVLGVFVDISWFYAGLEEFRMTVTRSFIVKIINVTCIFSFIHSPSDLYLFMIISSVFSLLGNGILYFGVKKRAGKLQVRDLDIKKHVVPTLKLFLPQVASLVYLQCDKIMINFLSDNVSNVGFYDQAERIVKMPLALITALSTVMLPRVANEFKKNNVEAVKKYVTLTLKFSLFMSIPLMFGIASIAGTMIPWFLGNGYEDVINIMITLSPIVLFISLSSVTGNQYLTAVNKTKVLTISYIVSALLNLVINFLLIPIYGPVGAAIGTISAEMCVILIQLLYIREIVTFTELLKMGIKYFIAGLIMAISCYYIGNYFGPTILSTILQVLCGTIIYFGILLIVRDEFFFDNLNKIYSLIRKKNKSRKA